MLEAHRAAARRAAELRPRVTWRWDLDAPSVAVEIDRGQMEQALLNILKNAIEAIDGEGTITVRLTSGAVRRR